MPAARSARFDAWAKSLESHPEATEQVLDSFYKNLYAPGFVYSVDRAVASKCTTPCLVLAGNDEAHPYPISEELSKLLPNSEFIQEWKTGAALTSPRAFTAPSTKSCSPAAEVDTSPIIWLSSCPHQVPTR